MDAVSTLRKSYCISETAALSIYLWLYEDKAKPSVASDFLQANSKEKLRNKCEKGSAQALSTLQGVGSKKNKSLSEKIEAHKTQEANDVVGASLSLTFNAFMTSTEADSVMKILSGYDELKAMIMKNVHIFKSCLQHATLRKACLNYCTSHAAQWKNGDDDEDNTHKTKMVFAFDVDAMIVDPWGQLKIICPKNFKAVDEFALANQWWHKESPSRVRTVLERLFTEEDRSGKSLTLKDQAASHQLKYEISAAKLDQLIREGDLYHHIVRKEEFVSVHRVVRNEMIIHAGTGLLSNKKCLSTDESIDELLAMASTQLKGKNMTSEQEAAEGLASRLCVYQASYPSH
eukprot:3800208-Pleurochrysis_carterae.AAC.1